jgi:hypothetical protein
MPANKKTGPYSQDILTRIYNVQWAGGLAVEFGDNDKDAPPKQP